MTEHSPQSPRIAVLLATYNGEAVLQEQLDSYRRQTVRPALLLASDDGSRDRTRDILEQFAASDPGFEVRIVDGPRRGAARNFLSLFAMLPEDIDIVALSDQDDVWLPDKLHRGQREIALHPHPDVPLLYCGRTWVCDEHLDNRRLSRGAPKSPNFCHALVQSVAGGNTMMLNRAAIDVVRAAAAETRKIVIHDWWLYQIITGVGGTVVFDTVPLLFYRQHGSNYIGANNGVAAKFRRLQMMMRGRLRFWNTVNINALTASAHRLTPENRQTLEQFAAGRNGHMRERLEMLRRTGLYRHGLAGKLSLYAAAMFGRL